MVHREKLSDENKREICIKIQNELLDKGEILTIHQASSYLKYKPSYMRKLIAREEIPFYQPKGKVLLRKNELDEWIKLLH